MKIVHVSISAPFIDSWGYQENLLPKYLQKAGTENFIIASGNDFPTYLKADAISAILAKGARYSIDGIEVRRIHTKRISSSFVITKGLRKVLEEIKPDVIFHHNLNCTSMPVCARYAKRCRIPMVCDNHADSINMSKNRLWVWFYYKLLTGLSCWRYSKQIYRAYGVTKSRCDFIHDYYGLSRSKIAFLPIGADVELADTISPGSILRQKYGLPNHDFVVVSGGKMGKEKGTSDLIGAVEDLKETFPQLKLVLFGRFEDEETAKQAEESAVTVVYGWCDRVKTLELLKLADVACWPIHHTTLIEDAVSVFTPLVLRKTGTTSHLINYNGMWLKEGTKEEIKESLLSILSLDEKQRTELWSACNTMRDAISYHTVAQIVIRDISEFRCYGFE